MEDGIGFYIQLLIKGLLRHVPLMQHGIARIF